MTNEIRNKIRLHKEEIEKLSKKIKLCKNYKKQLDSYHKNLRKKLRKREIDHEQYQKHLKKKVKGKTTHEWHALYTQHHKKYEEEIRRYKESIKQHKKEKRQNFRYKKLHKITSYTILTLMFIFLLTFAFYVGNNAKITGFVTNEELNETSQDTEQEIAETLNNETSSETSADGILSESNQTTNETLSEQTSEISKEKKEIKIQLKAEINKPVKWQEKIIAKNSNEIKNKIPSEATITNEQELDAEFFQIEYETPAPTKTEEQIKEGKRITINSPPGIGYTDILVKTDLPESLNVKDKNKIKIKWLEQNQEIQIQKISDTDNDGIYDSLEFIAPESDQSYEIIIEISKAEHLDSNREFISDIYEEVKSLDGVWSETIPNQDYVRVTFKIPLDSSRDITIFPRIISGNPKVEVYEIDGTIKIAEFTKLNENEYNKIFLTNLIGEQDTFDLKILGGSVQFEHIIDPFSQKLFEDCSTGAITDKWTTTTWSFGGGGDSGLCITAKNVQSHNMTSIPIDLTEAISATLNFTHSLVQTESGDFLKVYINSSSSGFVLIYTTFSTDTVNVQLNLGDYITMTSGVHIRAECTTNHNAEYCKWDNINLTATTPQDDEYPIFSQFTEVPSNNTTYTFNTNYGFNVTLNSTNGTVGLEFNGVNYSASGSSNRYNVTIPNLGVSNYEYYWWAYGNGTSRNYNFTLKRGYSVSKTFGQVTLRLNNSASNITISNGASVWLSANLTLGTNGRIVLYNNGTIINNATGNATNLTTFSTGNYNISAFYEGNQNFTENWSLNWFVDVLEATNSAPNNPTVDIASLDGSNDTSQNLNCSTSISDDDGDFMNLTISWINNTFTHLTFDFNNSYADGTNFSTLLNSTNTTNGDFWNCSARSYDGQEFSSWVNSSDTINITETNQAPIITSVSNETITVYNGLNAGPLSTNISFNFTVYDPNGFSDLTDASSQANFTRLGEDLRQNSSCSRISSESSGNYANYTCEVMMWWWDGAGAWNISVSISDSASASAQNASTTFFVGSTTGFEISAAALTWPGLAPGLKNQTSNNDPILLNNTGNTPIGISSGNISINITNLLGEIDNSVGIWAGNISFGISTGSNAECDYISNSTATIGNANFFQNATSATLSADNYTINNGTAGQEQLYFCISEIGSELTDQAYSTLDQGAWTIRILATLIATTGTATRRRKRKKKSKEKQKPEIKDDKLVRALALILDELKDKYSLNKKETMNILLKEMKEKYKLKKEEIIELIDSSHKEKIPSTIFVKQLGGLESVVKYMKENLSINYKEISMALNRDQRTIWTAYKKANQKMPEPLEIEDTEAFIPTTIFKDRTLTILEATISYLKNRNMSIKEIATTLKRDSRNIQTIYSRAKKKLANKNKNV